MADELQFVRASLGEGVATITLDRPPVNVLNIAMLHELSIVLEGLAEEEGVRVLVLAGAGNLFSAGVDVADHTPEKVDQMIPLFDRVCQRLAHFPVPTMAAVHGHALGGGCELVLCCDLALMAEGARIGQPEIQLAAIAPVAALRLPQLVGYRAAADLLFTGRQVPAEEAAAMGLVNEVAPADELAERVGEKAAAIAGLSRAALSLLKRTLTLGFGRWEDELPRVEQIYLEELMETADAHEGLAAFVEKRPPEWRHH